jgi:hypothetical protein
VPGGRCWAAYRSAGTSRPATWPRGLVKREGRGEGLGESGDVTMGGGGIGAGEAPLRR